MKLPGDDDELLNQEIVKTICWRCDEEVAWQYVGDCVNSLSIENNWWEVGLSGCALVLICFEPFTVAQAWKVSASNIAVAMIIYEVLTGKALC